MRKPTVPEPFLRRAKFHEAARGFFSYGLAELVPPWFTGTEHGRKAKPTFSEPVTPDGRAFGMPGRVVPRGRDPVLRLRTRGVRPSVTLVLLATALFVSRSGFAADAEPLRESRNEAFLTLFDAGRPLFQYRYDGRPCKPYVKELFTPKGVQVLRDAPADHFHHHGAMFAVAADGTTFWSEDGLGGRQVPGSDLVCDPSGPTTARQGVVRQTLRWIKPGETDPVLVESRAITVHAENDLDATLLTWRSVLRPGPNREVVELTGSHYYGLGLRFAQWMDQVGRFVCASGTLGDIVRGEERLTRAKWIAYVCPDDRWPVTVAVFDSPANPRHPAHMFTMPVSFAFISATLNLWKQPLKLGGAEMLDLTYGIAVWDGERSAKEIESMYRQWQKRVSGR